MSTAFKLIRLYADAEGESHFEELPAAQMREYIPGISFSDLHACQGFFLETFSDDFFEDSSPKEIIPFG